MGFNTYPSNPWPISTDKSGNGDYDLPIASADTVGGVMVGNGLSIDAETGVLSNTNPTPYTPFAYSTSEVNTDQKWVDGNDIYVIAYPINSLDMTGNTQTISHGIANINKVLKCEAYAYLPYCVVMNCYGGAQYYASCYCDETYINYNIKWGNITAGTGVVILYYTKTT